MAKNSSDTSGGLDFDALMNSEGGADAVESANLAVDAPSNLKSPGSKGLEEDGSLRNPPVTQNGGQSVSMDVIDLTRPTKTEGEASTGSSTAISSTSSLPASGALSSVANSTSHQSAAVSLPSVTATADGLSSPMAVSAFGTQLLSLGSQLKLTAEEQATAYKKANILALSALAKKGGPNVREMLAVQAKLQEFLTSLIALAGNTSPQLRHTVQALVQRLVTGTISEENFAMRIETDLHSQHQPSLLPFLKTSVPHLKTRLQLQQAIMKELLQRMAKEKSLTPEGQQQQQRVSLGASGAVAGTPQPSTELGQLSGSVQVSQQSGVKPQSSSVALQQVAKPQAQPMVVLSPSQQQLLLSQQRVGDLIGTSLASSTPQSQSQGLQQQARVVQAPSQVQVSVPSTVALLPSNSSTPPMDALPSTSQTQLQLTQAQLAYLSDDQKKLALLHHFQSLKRQQQRNQQLLLLKQEQQSKSATSLTGLTSQASSAGLTGNVSVAGSTSGTAVVGGVSVTPASVPKRISPSPQVKVSSQLHVAKTLRVASLQGALGAGAVPPHVLNYQMVQEKQQQLVKEQQASLTVGAAGRLTTQAAAQQTGRLNAMGSPGSGVSAASLAPQASKTSFATMKLSTMAVASRGGSVPSQAVPRGKGKSKKDAVEIHDEEDEEERMDFAGVNLQEEKASFLPQTVGETTSRTCSDELFLDASPLRRKVAPIAKLYGITDVSDDFLALLSHATEERLRDIVEQLTVVSRHRTESLKEDRHYDVVSEMKSQLKVLENIDRINHTRKLEREKEKILRAAKSRSKVEDPEMAAKIKEQAKQLQLEEEQVIRNKAANETALAAIGSRRKRTSAVALQQQQSGSDGASGLLSDGLNGSGTSQAASVTTLLGSPSAPRQHKRRITTRDLNFYMERQRETCKSVRLYKSFMK